ncbi:MAG: hypothetical protein QM770_18515 [Tepidisphaeraceae bacterium]
MIEIDGTFYLYATTDGMGHGLSTSGLPVVWKSKDFKSWSFSGSLFADNFDAKYWAPSAGREGGEVVSLSHAQQPHHRAGGQRAGRSVPFARRQGHQSEDGLEAVPDQRRASDRC